MSVRTTYARFSIFLAIGIGLLLSYGGCEKHICPECECLDCPVSDSLVLTEFGQKMKLELQQLFLDIEDLALMRVYNCTGDTCYWSGFDAGDPLADSRQIHLDFLETELVAVFKRFSEGKWTHSCVSIPFNEVVTFVVQNVTFKNQSGQVIRRANNVLVYLKDGTCPELNGSDTSHASIV